jgi:hypothetical protein
VIIYWLRMWAGRSSDSMRCDGTETTRFFISLTFPGSDIGAKCLLFGAIAVFRCDIAYNKTTSSGQEVVRCHLGAPLAAE